MIGLSEASTTLAGILLLSVVTIESGGALLLAIATGRKPATDIQRRFFRAGHAHAGVFVTLALVCQPFVDATSLDGPLEWLARSGVAVAAILMPAGFFLSVHRPGATRPNRLLILVPAGAVMLALGVVTLGGGLLAA